MAARSLGNATISFGLVSIPVKLFSASQPSSGVSFNMIHAKCGSRVRQQYFCPVDNEVVDRGELIKGYEVSKNRFVTFTPAELKALDEESTEAIEISEFVPASAVDPVYYDRAYYLSPDRGADKAYRLIAEVMRKSGKVALARYAARGKQYLVMLRPGPEGVGLVMQQLMYGDEVRPISEVPLPTTHSEVKPGELELAQQLVDRVSTDEFHPEAYKDDVKERVLAQIHRKADGESIQAPAASTNRAQVIDLMEALKQSLEASGGTRRSGAKAAEKPEASERKPAKRAGGAPPKARASRK